MECRSKPGSLLRGSNLCPRDWNGRFNASLNDGRNLVFLRQLLDFRDGYSRATLQVFQLAEPLAVLVQEHERGQETFRVILLREFVVGLRLRFALFFCLGKSTSTKTRLFVA